MTTTLRRAIPSDAPILTSVATSAKAHWGYDQPFLDACRAHLTITPSDISNGVYMVAEQNGEIVGFYQIAGTPPAATLDHMWVAPDEIGKGIGRALWADLLKTAQRAGFEYINIEADPYAEGFYVKMGARKVCEVESPVIPGRKLPLMRVHVPNDERIE